MGILMSGLEVKNRISFKVAKRYHATWRTTCPSSFPVYRVGLPVPARQFRQLPSSSRDSSREKSSQRPVKKRTKQERSLARENPSRDLETIEGKTSCAICQRWLEDFTENLVEGEASASGSEGAGSSKPHHPEPLPRDISGKHDVFTHFRAIFSCS